MIRRSRAAMQTLEAQLQDEREQREAAEVEANRLRAGLQSVPAGIVLADAAGRIVLRNPAAVVGGHGDVLLGDVVQQLLRDAIAGRGGEQRVELFGPPARVLAVRAIPLPGTGALAVIDDLSERTRLDSVRTDFVANISHELKTPVGALALLAETLADNDDTTVNRRLANKMVEEAHRASRTIDDLLELSRIELGGPGEVDEVDLSGVVGEVIARHRLAAEGAGIRLEAQRLFGVVVRGDRLQLASALSNLADNAIKYTDRGGTVTISATTTDEWVELAVSDSGVGIPTRDLDRVFERFYRVDRARSRSTGGTGLGLSIVRHVAANHGGAVTVSSVEGEGSTFTLRLPVKGVV